MKYLHCWKVISFWNERANFRLTYVKPVSLTHLTMQNMFCVVQPAVQLVVSCNSWDGLLVGLYIISANHERVSIRSWWERFLWIFSIFNYFTDIRFIQNINYFKDITDTFADIIDVWMDIQIRMMDGNGHDLHGWMNGRYTRRQDRDL